MAREAFEVTVLLDQGVTEDARSITVSKDIYGEALRSGDQRYLALSTNQSRHWEVFIAKQVSSPSEAHSTIWLSSAIYKRFCAQQVYARPAKPIPLSSVILSFPAATYHLVKENTQELQIYRHLGYILRTGDVVEINGYRGQVTLCEPVQQGTISPTTEVLLAKRQSTDEMSNMYGDMSDEDDEDDAGEDLEAVSSYGFSSLLGHSTLVNDISHNTHLKHSIITVANGAIHQKAYSCEPLTRGVFADQALLGAHDEDDQYRIFTSINTLVEMGLFSGDTVELSIESQSMHEPRTVRLYALPLDYTSERHGMIYLPPILYHNLLGSSASPSIFPSVSLRQVSKQKSYPMAKAVTLGRIPSPASTDRVLQGAFFQALKVHFETARRVIRAGDLILLGIDETLARVTATDETDNEVMSDYTQSSSRRNDTVGWFKIVRVETEEDDQWTGDAQVDSASTRMVQSGIQKARIPPASSWAGYYDLPSLPVPTKEPGGPCARLSELVQSTFSKSGRRARAMATILLHGARGSGKRTLVASVAASLGMHLLEVNCYDLVGETDVKTEAYLRLRFEKAAQCSPCLLLLRNIDALAKKKDDMESGQESTMRFILADCLATVAIEAGDQYPVAVVASTADKDKVPDGVLGCFRYDVEIGAPSESERLGMLQSLSKGLPLAPDVSVQSLAVRSAALVATDLVNVVKRAQNFAQDRMDELATKLGPDSVADLHIAGGWITAQDFDQAIGEARRNYSDSIGAPKIPNVTWDDVGGLASVKDDIMDTIQLPLERPELFASGMKKRSGILFYGPPGTGKTLLAKAVATSFSLNFFSVKGPELLNMYIGESEANVRRVFQRARDAKPCVVFFDELDSVAPKRGNQGDSGGVMDRIVSQLLSELDGMSEGKDGSGGVFVIGATNRPDLLDPALLRPGRFDKMLYLGVSDTDDAQFNILQALTRKFRLSPTLDLRTIARECPFTYTGADFYALCSDAMLKAMTRQAGAVDAKVKALDPPRSTQYFFDHLASKEDVEVVVSEADFRDALSELIPSVSQSELDHYKKVQAQFSPVKEDELPVDKGKGKLMESNGLMNTGTNGHFIEDMDEDEDMYA